MIVKIVTGTKINEIVSTLETIRSMNKKGIILPEVAKILCGWDTAGTIKASYYRISKW